MQFISFAVLIKRIRAIKNFMLDPDVPKRKKLLIIFGIIYLVSPIDLIPAPVLGFSIIDDMVLWGFILTHLSDELDKYADEKGDAPEKVRDARKKYKDKDIIESVGQVVDSEEESDDASGEE